MKIQAEISKIALGTVQFGMNYGISNTTGMPDQQEVQRILLTARQNGITTLDTAYGYGESEKVLGHAGINDWSVVSKFPKEMKPNSLENYMIESLTRLKQKKLYGYLAHSAETILKQPSLWHELQQLKQKGLVEKTGVSLYHPREIESLLKMGYVPDLIQIPVNLLDHRFVPSLAYYKSLGIEIHSRSAFLQGLFFVEKDKISAYFNPIKHVIQHIQDKFANKNALGAGLLFHCLNIKEIDKVVIGVNDAYQLNGLLTELKGDKGLEISRAGFDLENIEDIETMILPYNWPKN